MHGSIGGIVGGAILGALLLGLSSHTTLILSVFVGMLTEGVMFGFNFGIIGAILGNEIKKYQRNRIFNGYLVCNKCGEYYELKEDESPEDFVDECELAEVKYNIKNQRKLL